MLIPASRGSVSSLDHSDAGMQNDDEATATSGYSGKRANSTAGLLGGTDRNDQCAGDREFGLRGSDNPFYDGAGEGNSATDVGGERTGVSGIEDAQGAGMNHRELSARPFPEQQSASVMMVGLLVAALVIVLAVAGAALWKVHKLDRQLDTLEARFSVQETAYQAAVDTLPAIGTLGDDIARLKLRGDELDRRREQLRLAVDESQKQMLEEFIIRIIAVERIADRISRSRRALGEQAVQPGRVQSRPIAEKTVIEPKKTSSVGTAKPPQQAKLEPPAGVPAAETEPAADQGPWVVNLLSASTRAEAERQVAELLGQGIDAEVHSAVVKDQTWYRIRVVGFSTVDDARRYAGQVTAKTGLKGIWVARR